MNFISSTQNTRETKSCVNITLQPCSSVCTCRTCSSGQNVKVQLPVCHQHPSSSRLYPPPLSQKPQAPSAMSFPAHVCLPVPSPRSPDPCRVHLTVLPSSADNPPVDELDLLWSSSRRLVLLSLIRLFTASWLLGGTADWLALSGARAGWTSVGLLFWQRDEGWDFALIAGLLSTRSASSPPVDQLEPSLSWLTGSRRAPVALCWGLWGSAMILSGWHSGDFSDVSLQQTFGFPGRSSTGLIFWRCASLTSVGSSNGASLRGRLGGKFSTSLSLCGGSGGPLHWSCREDEDEEEEEDEESVKREEDSPACVANRWRAGVRVRRPFLDTSWMPQPLRWILAAFSWQVNPSWVSNTQTKNLSHYIYYIMCPNVDSSLQHLMRKCWKLCL